METNVFLSDHLPEHWQAILEREKTIRHQHEADVENTYRHAYETGQLSKYEPIRVLMRDVLPDIIKAIEAKCTPDNRARKYKSFMLRMMDEDYKAYAYIALSVMLDAAAKAAPMSKILAAIGRTCEEEAQAAYWKKTAPTFFNSVMTQQKKNTSDTTWQRTGLVVAMNRYVRGEYDADKTPHPESYFDPWDVEYKTFVMRTLFDACYNTTPLFELNKSRWSSMEQKEAANRLIPSKQLLEWVGDATARLGAFGGYYLPLPEPPRHWTDTQTGGYWTAYGGQLKLVKNRNAAYQEEILERPQDFAVTFKAVNAAQDTAWRINQRLLSVVKDLVHEGKAIAGLPSADDLPLPRCPKCDGVIIPGTDHPCFTDEAVLKEWKGLAHDQYKQNASLKGKRLRLALTLENAELLADDPHFYYVYQCDFRGRLYPVGNLTPQGTDLEKALLEFAEGIPLGKNGAKWLAIHTANCWGEDKSDYDIREAWTRSNTQWILDCATEPLRYRQWSEADSPFMFLAACMEWAEYIKQGDSYKSHIPVGLDGSCSGIQHYSALLRDEVGALATNVKMTPGQKRKSDIYGMVAEETLTTFRADLTGEDASKARYALLVLSKNLMSRKITKRAVMTLPYGSTFQACKQYVTEALMELHDVKELSKEDRPKFCLYVAKTVWEAIPKVVKGARVGMNYLKTLARLACKGATPVAWQTPTGFLVHQSYYLPNIRYINTVLNGNITLKTSLVEDSIHVDKVHQVSGIAPNFIHSLDASHLMFSVCAAKDKGINDFALVHDSLGTHAGRTEEFFMILREQFYKLYAEHQPLHEFVKNITPLVPEKDRNKITEPPIINTLCLQDILNAKFLFS